MQNVLLLVSTPVDTEAFVYKHQRAEKDCGWWNRHYQAAKINNQLFSINNRKKQHLVISSLLCRTD